MVTKIIKIALICILLAGGALSVLFLYSKEAPPIVSEQKPSGPVLIAGGIEIPISIADSEEERQNGLSNTANLEQGTGKFFIFDTPGMYGFWMKDMNYAIDIIWLDATMKIIDVAENVLPETYPKVFFPSSSALYVLEVNAFDAKRLGFTRGTVLTLENDF